MGLCHCVLRGCSSVHVLSDVPVHLLACSYGSLQLRYCWWVASGKIKYCVHHFFSLIVIRTVYLPQPFAATFCLHVLAPVTGHFSRSVSRWCSVCCHGWLKSPLEEVFTRWQCRRTILRNSIVILLFFFFFIVVDFEIFKMTLENCIIFLKLQRKCNAWVAYRLKQSYI